MAGVSGCIKYSMFIFNFLFWLCGIFILAVAIWIRVSKDGQELLSSGESGMNPYVGVNILIAVGATIMVLGFLGCCGAIKESRCMLLLFFIGLFLILLLQVAAGILGAAFRSESEKILNETLHKNVELLSATTENAEVFQKALSEFQEEIDTIIGNYYYLYFTDEATVAQKVLSTMGNVVTHACFSCLFFIKQFKCCGLVNGPADWGQNFEKYSKSCECPDAQLASCISYDNKYVYNQPCISFIKDLLKKHIIIIIGIAFGLAVIEILGLIFSMVLFCQIGSK